MVTAVTTTDLPWAGLFEDMEQEDNDLGPEPEPESDAASHV